MKEIPVRFYSQVFLPYFCDLLLGQPFISKLREELLVHAYGDVLEIGLGTGLNLLHYPKLVHKITTVEPNAGMYRLAQKRIRQTKMKVDPQVLRSEQLPFQDQTFDCAVSTFTLCSIDNVAQAISEVYRVLKVGGSFLFLEHGLSPDPAVQKWQQRLNGLQRFFFEGCHLDRDIQALIKGQPFSSIEMEQFHLPRAPKTHGYLYCGIAPQGTLGW